MAMTFFNPASLLPSPDVAVNPEPKSNMGAVAIDAALNAIQRNVKQYKEVQDLKANAEGFANYYQDKSPQLADMIRQRAENYKPNAFLGYGGVDVKEEQSFLLNGALKLADFEQSERKMAADGNSIRYQNNYAAQLRAAESNYGDLNRQWNAWEQEENNRIEFERKTRADMAAKGVDELPPEPVRRENPFTSERDFSRQRFNNLINKSASEIQDTSTIAATKGAGRTAPIPGSASTQPIISPRAEVIPDLPSQGGQAPEGTLLFPGEEMPTPAPADIPKPQSTEDAGANPTVDSIIKQAFTDSSNPDGNAPIQVTPTPTSAPSSDPLAKVNADSLARKKASATAAQVAFDTTIEALKRDRDSYVDPRAVDSAIAQAQELKEVVASLPDPGTPAYATQVRTIQSSFNASVNALQRNTVTSEKKERAIAGQETLTYVVKDVPKQDQKPITVFKRSIDGIPRYFAVIDGKDTDVTNRIGNEWVPATTINGNYRSLKDILGK